MLFLALIGIFTVDDFRSKRKIAILIMVIAGAVLTPSSDPFSMLMLAVPMILLYELGDRHGRAEELGIRGQSRPTRLNCQIARSVCRTELGFHRDFHPARFDFPSQRSGMRAGWL